MEDLITELEEILIYENVNVSTLIHAMTNFRLIIEKNKLQSDYPVLNLYCNWVLHDTISASNTAFRILENLSNSMIKHNAGVDDICISSAVIEGLKLHTVQTEILSLAKLFSINIKQFSEDQYWQYFGYTLLEKLKGRPIKFPEKMDKRNQAKQIYESIYNKAKESGEMVNAVIAIFFDTRDNHICWSIVTVASKKKEVKIIGEMVVITDKMIEEHEKKKLVEKMSKWM